MNDLRQLSTSALCQRHAVESDRAEAAAKDLAEARKEAKAIRDEIERRMGKADVNCLVSTSGHVFMQVDLEDFPTTFVDVRSVTPLGLDRMLVAKPPAAPDDAEGGPMPERDPAVVAAVKGWALTQQGGAA